jgi:thiamine-monophosphate kinase
MKLSDLGEFGLIDRIRKLSQGKTSSPGIGIGDDAAALTISPSQAMLVTTDLLIEDIHFNLSYTDYYSLGWKSAAVNLSDIAAMGGLPRFCLTALGIPRGVSAEHILDFYRGFNRLLRLHKTELVGGDTCSSGRGLFISVTAIGEARPRRIIARSGALPGDAIFVTGTLGDSAAGLEMLRVRNSEFGVRNKKRKTVPSQAATGRLVERHLRPVPRVAQGLAIANSGCASAMIDVSDGLSSDLFHICEQSKAGAEIFADRIPLSVSLRRVSVGLSKSILEYALYGGEDYELLFTVPRRNLRKLRSLKMPITEIGTITTGRTMCMRDDAGKKRTLKPKGFDHFRS